MEMLIITICILSLLVLFFGAAAAGVLVGTVIRRTRRESRGAAAPEPQTAAFVENTLSDSERRKIKEEREREEAQLRAFQQLLDYNPEIAYGLGRATADTEDRGSVR